MTVLADSNVLIDLALNSEWAGWAADRLEELAGEVIALNQLIYAEVSYAYASPRDLDSLIDGLGLERANIPWEAAFPAARAFRAYRERGGTRTSPLPDFYIGAHAEVMRMTLLTRDGARYRTYFPDVRVIAPG